MHSQKERPQEAVLEEFIAYKTQRNRRPEYLKTLRNYLGRFMLTAPPVSLVKAEHVESWLKERAHTPAAQCAAMGRLSSFFTFCQRRDYMTDNPIRKLERPIIERKPPRILSPQEARALLDTTRKHRPDLLGYIAIGLFAGARPSEMCRLAWSDVDATPRLFRDLEGYGVLTVSAAASKVRRRRITPLHPTLIKWLELCEREGMVVKQTRTHWMTGDLAKMAGFSWDLDLLRHSCASYMLALFQDSGRVSHWLGNSQSVLMNHYYEIVSPKDCVDFWLTAP